MDECVVAAEERDPPLSAALSTVCPTSWYSCTVWGRAHEEQSHECPPFIFTRVYKQAQLSQSLRTMANNRLLVSGASDVICHPFNGLRERAESALSYTLLVLFPVALHFDFHGSCALVYVCVHSYFITLPPNPFRDCLNPYVWIHLV